MKNTKKFLAIGMSVLMAASLVACGSASEETTTAQSEENVQAEDSQQTDKEKTEDSSTGEPVTVTFWNSFTGADGDMLVDLVNRFNEENQDNITVEMDISADFDSQLSTAFAAGTGPTWMLKGSAS